MPQTPLDPAIPYPHQIPEGTGTGETRTLRRGITTWSLPLMCLCLLLQVSVSPTLSLLPQGSCSLPCPTSGWRREGPMRWGDGQVLPGKTSFPAWLGKEHQTQGSCSKANNWVWCHGMSPSIPTTRSSFLLNSSLDRLTLKQTHFQIQGLQDPKPRYTCEHFSPFPKNVSKVAWALGPCRSGMSPLSETWAGKEGNNQVVSRPHSFLKRGTGKAPGEQEHGQLEHLPKLGLGSVTGGEG